MRVRALGYVRVSKAREEMISPELQLTAIQDWCARNNAALVDVVQDLDATGRNFARAGVQQVIDRTVAGDADLIVVWKWSRFGRNIRDALINIDRVEAAGGRLVAATEDFDTSTSVGRFGRGQFLLMAQFESERIGDQWKEAHARRAKQGLPHSGYPRFGYVYTREHGFQPDPDTSPYLAECYNLYLGGFAFSRIATWLTSEGVPTVNGGMGWWPQVIKTSMDSGTAAGLLRTGDAYIEGAHPAIIDRATWDRYLGERRRNKGVPAHTRRPHHPYAGILRCGTCDGPMKRSSTVSRDLVTCTRYMNMLGTCPAPASIRMARIDEAVAVWLAAVAPDINAKTLARPHRKDAKQATQRIMRLEASLARLTRQYADGDIPREVYLSTRDQITNERDALQAKADEAAWRATAPPPPPDLMGEWGTLDVDGKRAILRALISAIIVRRRGDEPRLVIVPAWE